MVAQIILLSPLVRQPLFSTRGFHSAFLRSTGGLLRLPPQIRRRLTHGGLRLYVAEAVNFEAMAIVQDGIGALLVTAGAYSLVFAFDELTKRNIIKQVWVFNSEQSLSRKVVHVLSGLLYMASWPIFSSSIEAKYFVAVAPLLNCIRLLAYGFSIFTDESLVNSVTREGKSEELLRGPLYYVVVLMFCAIFFWRESPVGIISVAMMSGGDGFADIIGRKFGSVKLPYNCKKSWIGSISMFIFGSLFSILMLYYFSILGYLYLDWRVTPEKVFLVSLAATLVESLPFSEVIDDNITVPVTSMLTASLLFT
ncbi:hypothetical protein HPP92_023755 [Vanilla planifolia]|uniref:phytol kinase n=1 Tax=Vanilla planifolia TaxID=51239 RepID=A0A835PJ23_VANPL|nr:hypothetical protein HPP92_024097 [Vanilla planifolia]KAG0455967.1 hypothetical protein HPP92_023755 [Vanilla planifolia]